VRPEIFGIPVLGTLDSKSGDVKMRPLAVVCQWCGKASRGIRDTPKGRMHGFCFKAAELYE
jgi:hypothetical protein